MAAIGGPLGVMMRRWWGEDATARRVRHNARIRETVPAGTKGVGDCSEDAVVVEWEENGATRAVSIPVRQLVGEG